MNDGPARSCRSPRERGRKIIRMTEIVLYCKEHQ
jgi:hypothetical protein